MVNLRKQKEFYKNINYKTEILAGLTVAITMIPESLSFAIFANISPLIGLYGAFFMGIVTAIFGGRPAMISGGAGATIIVLIPLIASHGVAYLFPALILAGVIQIGIGVFKLGSLVKLIPKPVMIGFLNGLAIIIFSSQWSQFYNKEGALLPTKELITMIALVASTIGISLLCKKKIKRIPSSLLAISLVFLVVMIFHIDTKKVVDIADIAGTLPKFELPHVAMEWQTLRIVLPYAIIMASVGLIESLLCLEMTNEITKTKGNTNKEAWAQGLANMTNGFFGAMGGCAMVAQTLVNVNSGARTRFSNFAYSFFILSIILLAFPLIQQIPMAALVGVMCLVSLETFQWYSILEIKKIPKRDTIVMLIVTIVTATMHNLALAVLIGFVLSMLLFIWDFSKTIRVLADKTEKKKHQVSGYLFFGSAANFTEQLIPKANETDTTETIIDCKALLIYDWSGASALLKLNDLYQENGQTITFCNLCPSSLQMVQKTGIAQKINLS